MRSSESKELANQNEKKDPSESFLGNFKRCCFPFFPSLQRPKK